MSEEKKTKLKVKLAVNLDSLIDLKAMIKWIEDHIEIDTVEVEQEI